MMDLSKAISHKRYGHTASGTINPHPNNGQTPDYFRHQNSGTAKDQAMRFRDFS